MSDSPRDPLGAEETAIRTSASLSGADVRERFTPGTILADRFRIIAPLARGGMGEVYRADDIRLGQTVALKFLPASLERDPDRLQRLYAEVRLGRQVSHPNVCRLYDVGEYEGTHFIAMEYIDGEDLGSLLRRIGKLPQEKALDLTREICAGLAAAHALGIIHRDLKPANIMIDGRGRARVTDFGLAALEEDVAGRREIVGTPDYMPPEQARGERATQRGDLYSLGLILYEMFTGRRAAERASAISQNTKELDPALQRVIMRCVDPDPTGRPASIHSVMAALPGGDPLQAALDAGETPSPEMIAAAGTTGELPARFAVPVLIVGLILSFAAFALLERVRLTSIVPVPKTQEALAERARELVRQAGYPARPFDVMYTFAGSRTAQQWLSDRGEKSLERLATIQPSPLAFVYRESPRNLIPERNVRGGPAAVRVAYNDPPLSVPGMVRVVLDADGRLMTFHAVPPDRSPPSSRSPQFDWRPLLASAGFDPQSLRAVPAEWSVPVDNDAKVAWTGTYAGQPDIPMRIEAATYRGKPVAFRVIAPWTDPIQPVARKAPLIVRVRGALFVAALLVVLVAGVVLARRNIRRGRADRQGAARLAVFTLVTGSLSRYLLSHHWLDFSDEVNTVVFPVLTHALFPAATVWLFYVALEPYLRRRWPRALIGWSRLVGGRVGDALVGRDLLTGFVAGSAIAIVGAGGALAEPFVLMPVMSTLGDSLRVIGLVFDMCALWARYALQLGVILLLGHVMLRSRIAAVIFTFVIVVLIWPSPGTTAWLDLAFKSVIAAILVFVFLRWGLLAAAVTLLVQGLIVTGPTTLQTSRWFFASGALMIAVVLAIGVYGFFRSLGAQPLFSGAVLDE
ncbi:MAG TPA: protein kinase [Thermoanaerobaculia bacterium]|nr:protein kinase [Thermoanaerobaculia bacterium]